jgi:hypothetical protein
MYHAKWCGKNAVAAATPPPNEPESDNASNRVRSFGIQASNL